MARDLKIPHRNYVSSQFTILGDAVAEANERIRNSNTESKLVTFVAQWENSDQQAVVYQQALENSPTVILVDGMAGSHQLLEDVVKNPSKGLSNLIEQLGEFYKKAKALNDALEKD